MASPERDKVDSLDSLRAFAALSVMWFHFTQAGQIQAPLLKASGQYGFLGAHMFFVISGFVMPWALDRGGYDMAAWPRFLAKRLLRLHPPYLASIVAVQLLWVLSSLAPSFRGPPYVFEWQELLLHLFYLPDWFGVTWALPVYWTLSIEIQFYVILALGYPLLTSSRPWLRRSALLALCLGSAVVADKRFALGYGAFFGLGLATFLVRRGLIPAWEYAAFCAIGGLALMDGGTPHAVAGLGMAAAIALLRRPIPGLTWVGHISFSLYLLHVPIGGRLLNLGARLEPNLGMQLLLLAVTIAASLLASMIFYRWVELPAQTWSQRLPYRRRSDPAPEAVSAAAAEYAPPSVGNAP